MTEPVPMKLKRSQVEVLDNLTQRLEEIKVISDLLSMVERPHEIGESMRGAGDILLNHAREARQLARQL